jgi:myo-inositol-1(or 4)-monophosphatase
VRADGAPHLYNPAPERHGVLVAGAQGAVRRLLGYGLEAA